MLAIAAMAKLMMTPGPANFLATIPATRYIPVPTHEPTPRDVKSMVVRHRCWQRARVKYTANSIVYSANFHREILIDK